MEPSRISAAGAKTQIDRGEAILFVDTRNEKAWTEADRKLPGAIRIPVDEIELRTHKLPRDRCIVTYCTWKGEASSARAAQKLRDVGFKDVTVLEGGFDAWQQAGYPTENK